MPSALKPAVDQLDRPEHGLLLRCARTERLQPADFPDEATLDWPYLAALAGRHRLEPLVCRALAPFQAHVPPEVWAELKQAAAVFTVHDLMRTRELLRLLDRFAAEGLTALAFKGPVLGVQAYGDVALRPFGDLDLLLPRDQLLRAKALLVADGYRPDPPMTEGQERAYLDQGFAYGFYHKPQRLKVELHATLTHRLFSFDPDLEALRQRAVEVPVAGKIVRTLHPDDLLLFLCVHGAKHEWAQLLWICDVAELLRRDADTPRLDWPRIAAMAGETRTGRMLRLGLSLAHHLLEAPLPPAMEEVLRSDERLENLRQQVLARLFPRPGASRSLLADLQFHTAVRDTRRDQLIQVREKVGDRVTTFFMAVRSAIRPSPKDRAFVSLPPHWAFLYVFVRPVRVARDRWRQARKR